MSAQVKIRLVAEGLGGLTDDEFRALADEVCKEHGRRLNRDRHGVNPMWNQLAAIGQAQYSVMGLPQSIYGALGGQPWFGRQQ